MHQELIEKIRKIRTIELSDEELNTLVTEAMEKTYEDSYDQNSGVYRDDLLLYYVLGQIALFSGDLAEYSNYCILYNNAAAAFHRQSFEQTGSFNDGCLKNVW